PMDETKFAGPPTSRGFIAFGEHADCNRIPILHDRFKLTRFRAHKAVRRRARIARFVSKPREADWYAPANGAATLPMRLRADKERFLSVARLPGGYVRAVQIHLPYGRGGGDAHFGEAAVACDDFGHFRYSKPAFQLRDCAYRAHAVTSTRASQNSQHRFPGCCGRSRIRG